LTSEIKELQGKELRSSTSLKQLTDQLEASRRSERRLRACKTEGRGAARVSELEGTLAELQKKLDRVTLAKADLQKKHSELKQHYDSHQASLRAVRDKADKATSEAEGLRAALNRKRAEAEVLRNDLRFSKEVD
jgi:chromosome segregation ATPase